METTSISPVMGHFKRAAHSIIGQASFPQMNMERKEKLAAQQVVVYPSRENHCEWQSVFLDEK